MMTYSSRTVAFKTCLSWNLHIKKTKNKIVKLIDPSRMKRYGLTKGAIYESNTQHNEFDVRLYELWGGEIMWNGTDSVF